MRKRKGSPLTTAEPDCHLLDVLLLVHCLVAQFHKINVQVLSAFCIEPIGSSMRSDHVDVVFDVVKFADIKVFSYAKLLKNVCVVVNRECHR